jgi:ABC-type ATPase involved in cell division
MRPTEGQILANDKPVSRWISRHLDLWRRKVGLVFQEPHLFSDLTIVENLAVPLVPLGIKRKEANRLIMDFLSRLDLTHLAAQPAGSLSGGERQRLTIARALIVHPMFLLADEPTSFQDDDHTTHILNLFIQEQNRGASVVVCSHDDRMISCGDFDVILKLNQGHLEPA